MVDVGQWLQLMYTGERQHQWPECISGLNYSVVRTMQKLDACEKQAPYQSVALLVNKNEAIDTIRSVQEAFNSLLCQ
jgi:hypothetical protein